MLVFEPSERITVDEALAHPFLEELYSPDDEPSMDQPLDGDHFAFESTALSKEEIKDMVLHELSMYPNNHSAFGK